MYPRAAHARLLAALDDTPAVLLIGPRQSGKSTLIRTVTDDDAAWSYVTLDDAGVQAAALSDPAGFLAGHRGNLAIDEVQKAPGLLSAIKAAIDRDRRPGRFLLTGSANVLALPRVSESLAGRVEVITLWPLAQHECEGVVAPAPFIERAFERRWPRQLAGSASWRRRSVAGGFPEALARTRVDRRAAWFESYLATVLSRDVRDVADIAQLPALPRLLRLLATRAGSTLNAADLARSVDAPQTTLKRYLAILDTLFLTTSLSPWHANLGKRLVKAPKLYLGDSGLLAHLLGVTSGGVASAHDGALLEGLVVLDLIKQCESTSPRVVPHHFRTHEGHEVDVLLEDPRRGVVGLEIKATRSPSSSDFRGLRLLGEALGDRFVAGAVLYAGDETLSFGERLHAVPLATLWEPASRARAR